MKTSRYFLKLIVLGLCLRQVFALEMPPALEAEASLFKGIVENKEKKEIIFASTAPLGGNLYRLGKEWVRSMAAVFAEENKENGVHGYRLNLDMRDDKYDPAETRKNIKALLEKTSIFLAPFGSDFIDVLADFNNIEERLVLFPNAGATQFRTKDYSSVYFLRPSTGREVEALIDYAVKTLSKGRIAIFYEESLWGKDGLAQAQKYLKKINVPCVATGSYGRNTVNVRRAVSELSSKLPDAVICIANYRPAYNFIRRMVNEEQEQTIFFGVSETAIIQDYLKKSRGVSLITSSVVPNPWKSNLKLAKDFRKFMSAKFPQDNLSIISFESYANARLTVECLKVVEPPITKEKFVAAIEQFEDFDGIKLSFDPETRTLSQAVWINTGKAQDWQVMNP